MSSPTSPTVPAEGGFDYRAQKIYRVPPGHRLSYITPMVGHHVIGEYKHGSARVPFEGTLTVAYDPIRTMYVVVLTPGDGPPIAVNLSSLYDIHRST